MKGAAGVTETRGPIRFRKWSWLICAGLVIAGSVLAVQSGFRDGFGRTGGAGGVVTAVELPMSPLTPRRNASAVWTGDELIVLGGVKGQGMATPDGAAFDPRKGKWRPLAASPFVSLDRPAVTWNGHEVIVIGGETTGGVTPTTAPSSGNGAAAYDPVTDEWRGIQSPPERISSGTALWTGDAVVLGAGWEKHAALYVLEQDRDTWEMVVTPAPVVAMSPAGPGHISVVMYDGGTSISFADYSATGLMPRPGLSVDGRVRSIGVVNTPGGLVVAALTQREELLLASLANESLDWTIESQSDRPVFMPPVSLEMDPSPGPLVYCDGKLVTIHHNYLVTYELASKQFTSSEITGGVGNTNPFCAVGAAYAWTGSSLMFWGGQACLPRNMENTGNGFRVDIE